MIDTHCHLYFDELYNNIDKVINDAKAVGVKYIICPSTDIKTAEITLNICDKYDMVYAAVGIHPHDTANYSDKDILKLEELLKHKKVIAIGEIGLDYHYDFSPKEIQKIAFRDQLQLAINHSLPVVIHNRESDNDLISIYESFGDYKPKAQFHCFSSDINFAKRVIQGGSYISFTGNITYRNREDLRSIIRQIELDDILLETDSPFMSPKGKPNTPANLPIIVNKLSELFNLTADDVVRTTNANVFKLFKLGNMQDIAFTYKIGNSLYINVTNRCNADCVFCDRNGFASIKGYNLKMPKNLEPDSEVYIKEIGAPKQYDEIVFCGYGEPTIRVDVIKQIAKYVKENNGKTRINTNGHGNKINKRNILPELQNLIDTISISLNSTDKKQYSELMRVSEDLFDEMINFTVEAKKYIPNVVLSIVNLDSVEKEKAKKMADDLGVKFRIREYF